MGVILLLGARYLPITSFKNSRDLSVASMQRRAMSVQQFARSFDTHTHAHTSIQSSCHFYLIMIIFVAVV